MKRIAWRPGLGPFLGQILRCGGFQLRGDLFQGRGEAYLFAEADSNRIRVSLHARCVVHRISPDLSPLCRNRASGQTVSGIAHIVHHSIIQAHQERVSVRRADAVQGAKALQQNTKTLRNVIRDLAQPSRRRGRRFGKQFLAAMQTTVRVSP